MFILACVDKSIPFYCSEIPDLISHEASWCSCFHLCIPCPFMLSITLFASLLNWASAHNNFCFYSLSLFLLLLAWEGMTNTECTALQTTPLPEVLLSSLPAQGFLRFFLAVNPEHCKLYEQWIFFSSRCINSTFINTEQTAFAILQSISLLCLHLYELPFSCPKYVQFLCVTLQFYPSLPTFSIINAKT